MVFALALVTLLIAVAVWFLPGRAAREPAREEGPPVAGLPAVAAPPPGAAAAATAAVARRRAAAPSVPDDPIARYREQTRYAPTSGVLYQNAIDLLEPNRRYETLRPIGDTVGRGADEEVRYVFTADKYYYEGDDVVHARLEVRRGGETAPVAIGSARAVPENGSGAAGDARELEFRGIDGRYETQVDLAEQFPEHHGPILLEVEFEYEPGKVQQASLRVFSTPVDSIPARFVGRYRDAPENGSLVVEAQVEVFSAGFYRFDANLFSGDGAPLAFADFKGDLEPGIQWVPLQFFGLLLIDLGLPGPYELRNLRGYRFLDGAYPDRLRMRDAVGSYWTHPYDLAGFSDEEYASPQKEHVLQLLEQDARAGIVVDMPEIAE